MTTLPPEPEYVPPTPASAVQRVMAAFDRIAEVDRPEVWITLRSAEDVLVDAKAVDERVRAGERPPLAGLLLAVKDNVDVAGLPTTAGCPAFAYTPEVSATAVRRLTQAGAVVLGKTNLDQFATGLVGSRSPYGAVRGAKDPLKVSGGSSSGSAVAVALELVDIAIGTDTAGSGRVPAAFNGIVGLKPTLGLVPKTGVVPAARSYDCVTIFARKLTTAQLALAEMTGPDADDPQSRAWPDSVRLSAGEHPRVAIPDDKNLAPLSPSAHRAFVAAVASLRASGAILTTVDIAPLLDAATLLYDGALVAERYAAVGEFLREHPDDADPTVAKIILAAGELKAHDLVADQERLAQAKATAEKLLAGQDALVLPTVPEHPTLAQVEKDPVGVNKRLGTYTNFVNLLDMAGVAVPAGTADGGSFGLTVLTRAFDDQIALDLAALFTGELAETPYPDKGIDLVVFGAHLRGQPLNSQLVDLGARFAEEVLTAEEYRMVALPTTPPKPGLLHVGAGGAALEGERWLLSPAALGKFLAGLPAPMLLGRILLDDGTEAVGFFCDPSAAEGAKDITAFGGWRAYLRRIIACRKDPV
ncbi:allophanate hydrolase [Amycolatopsis sp. NPDC059657]|uniref:allophanate hydrolase n=1 Tax=Amycolatopsis sp. NPDC059657 TaxID=3346899 RepID=UPI00366E10C2